MDPVASYPSEPSVRWQKCKVVVDFCRVPLCRPIILVVMIFVGKHVEETGDTVSYNSSIQVAEVGVG